MNRYLLPFIKKDLKEKMVFLGGPRQVGKTHLSLQLLSEFVPREEHPAYLNWDVIKSRKIILSGELPLDQPLIVLDEVHKYKSWRNLVKGYYDRYKSRREILITGSARLDFYRRGGDSLQGRYHFLRLHPLTTEELGDFTRDSTELLLKFGGFPEPFFKADAIHYARWQKERCSRILQEDLQGLEQVNDLSQMDLLMTLLSDRAAGILSVNSLREDLSCAFATAERYVSILENLYYCYRIKPYYTNRVASVKKEKKLYLWDWAQCESSGQRFENFVASHLWKLCHFLEDTSGSDTQLFFLRDDKGREVDFLVTQNRKILFAVECKLQDSNVAENLRYFSSKMKIPICYQVHLGEKEYELPSENIKVINWERFASEVLRPFYT